MASFKYFCKAVLSVVNWCIMMKIYRQRAEINAFLRHGWLWYLGFNKKLLFLFKPIHQFSDDKMFDLERDAKEGHLPDFEERKKKRIIEVRINWTKILESYLTTNTHFVFVFRAVRGIQLYRTDTYNSQEKHWRGAFFKILRWGVKISW